MIEYVVSKEFTSALDDMLSNEAMPEFNPIREQELKIYSLLVVRENAKGEPIKKEGPPITCAKIPAVYKALCNGDFVVLGENDYWTHSNGIQQKAALHHALMTINVEIDDKEQLKLSKRKPDVVAFTHTIAHFGAWNATLIDFRDAFKLSAKQFAENVNPTA